MIKKKTVCPVFCRPYGANGSWETREKIST